MNPEQLENLTKMAGEIEKKLSAIENKQIKSEELKAEVDKIGAEQLKLARKMLDLQQASTAKGGEMKQQGLGDRLVSSQGYVDFCKGLNRKVYLAAESPVSTPAGSVQPDYRGIQAEPQLPNSVQAAFGIPVPTVSNSISWLKEKAFQNAAAETAEGAQKPESKAEFEQADAPVRTIAHFIRITKQLAEDAPALAAYINNRMSYFLERRIEKQLLNGDGTGQNLSGIFKEGNYVVHGFTYDTLPATDTVLDLIRRCATKINSVGYRANTLFINPVDFDTIRGMKDSNGQYLMGSPLQDNASVRPWGLNVCESSEVTEGQFMVADTVMGATIYNRQGTTLEMFEQDGDNVIKNLITIRAECRKAFTVESVNCFVGGKLEIGAKAAG